MTRTILLDTGVIGLLVSRPNLPRVAAGIAWLNRLRVRDTIVIADIIEYELRRELYRLNASAKLVRLDYLLNQLRRVEVSHDAWIKAAEFWATVRRSGRPTASPDALDSDAILAGVAAPIGPPAGVVVATTNVRHLARFPGIMALTWDQIS